MHVAPTIVDATLSATVRTKPGSLLIRGLVARSTDASGLRAQLFQPDVVVNAHLCQRMHPPCTGTMHMALTANLHKAWATLCMRSAVSLGDLDE